MDEEKKNGGYFDSRGLILLSMGHLVTDINTAILPALLPFLKESLHLSYAMAGTIILFYSFTSSIVQPIFGIITDRKAVFWFLPLGCLFSALGMALIGVAHGYWQIVALAVLSGLGVAIYHPEGWRMADFFAGEKKATGTSIFAVGGNLGFALGPLLATFFIKTFGLWGTLFFLLPGGGMAGIFLASRFWRVKNPPSPKTGPPGSAITALRSAMVPMSLLLGMVTLRSWAHVGIMTFIPFYYISHMKGDPLHVGRLLFAFLAAGTVGTFLGGPLADRFGHKRFVLFSLGLSTPLLVLFLLTSGFWAYFWFILAGLILIISFSVSMVMGQSFMPQHVGTASGLMLGLAFGTGGVGAALLGYLADRLGVPFTLWVVAFIPWLAFPLTALIPYPYRPKGFEGSRDEGGNSDR